MLPLSPDRAERHGFEYKRNGTLSLYAALNTKTGKVQGKTARRHTSKEFVSFLTDIVAPCGAEQEIHIICDNLSAHKTKQVAEFLRANPNVQLHFTPTYSSWLNQVELWFSKLQRDVITRGIFTSTAGPGPQVTPLYQRLFQRRQALPLEILQPRTSHPSWCIFVWDSPLVVCRGALRAASSGRRGLR